MTDDYSAALAQAAQLGRDAARAAASWTNDRGDAEAAARLLVMVEDGDPAVWDSLPARPDLSGEMSGAPTPQRLAAECGIDYADADPDDVAGLCASWETAVDCTFEAACVAQLRAQLPAACPRCGHEGAGGPWVIGGHDAARTWLACSDCGHLLGQGRPLPHDH